MNIALPVEAPDSELLPPVGASWISLPPAEQLLLWSMRHMLVCWPSCGSVRGALHAAYGETALGVEHLLRCLLTAIGAWSARGLKVGDPTCAPLLADEGVLLFVLRTAHRAPDEARAALAELCAEPRAAVLLPLAAELAAVAGVTDRGGEAAAQL
jgi:hypothetical protein